MRTHLRLLAAAVLLCAPLSVFAQPTGVPVGSTDPIRVAVPVIGVDPDTKQPTSAGGTSGNAAVAFRQFCTTSAVAMADNKLRNGVIIKALSDNSSIAYIGPVGVSASTGYPLAAGEAISYGVANTTQLYLICSAASGAVAVTGN